MMLLLSGVIMAVAGRNLAYFWDEIRQYCRNDILI